MDQNGYGFAITIIILLFVLIAMSGYQIYYINRDKFSKPMSKTQVPVMPDEQTGYDSREPIVNTLPKMQNANFQTMPPKNFAPTQYPLNFPHPPTEYSLSNQPHPNYPPLHPPPPLAQFNEFTQKGNIPYAKETGMYTQSVKKSFNRFPEGMMAPEEANKRFFS